MQERTAVLVGPHMPDKETFYVMREDTCLGRIVDCEFDLPRWFGRFEADDAFGQVDRLFRTMFDAIKNGRIEEYNKLLVEAANLNLVVRRSRRRRKLAGFLSCFGAARNCDFPGR